MHANYQHRQHFKQTSTVYAYKYNKSYMCMPAALDKPFSVCEPNDLSFCESVSRISTSSACSFAYTLLRFSTCWIITSTVFPIRFSWASTQTQEFRWSDVKSYPEHGLGINNTMTTTHTWWIAPSISERLDTRVMDWLRISRFFCSLWTISMDWLSSSHLGARA